MEKKKVLFVEDNEKVMAGNLKKFLREGYDVSCAATLAVALSLIHRVRPDVIVLDIMLPDGNGLDFIKKIARSESSSIPVLLLTGLATNRDILRGLKAGGNDYMTKPYNFDELLERVEALIQRRKEPQVERNFYSATLYRERGQEAGE